MDKYTKAWVRLIGLAKLFSFLPWGLYAHFGSFIGKRFSFLHHHRQNALYNLQNGLGLSQKEAQREFELNCKSSGVAMCMIEKLAHIPNEWLSFYVEIEDKALLEEIGENGGIIFTLHCFHHNLLMSYFKTIAKKTYPIVNPPAAFSSDDFLYDWTVRLNNATQTNLFGGRMLYVDDKKKLFEDMNGVLNDKGILIVLCDFNSDAKNSELYSIFGKSLNIPVGALKYAEGQECNAYFAGFRWRKNGGYALSLSRLDNSNGRYPDNYMQQLEAYLRKYPYVWQNWEHL